MCCYTWTPVHVTLVWHHCTFTYSNKMIIAVGLSYECLVLDSELSTCSLKLFAAELTAK